MEEEKKEGSSSKEFDFFDAYSKHPLYKVETVVADPLPEQVEGQCP